MIKMMITTTTTTTSTSMPVVTHDNNKSVSFSRRRQVRPSLHIEDYTQQEIADCWYSVDEIIIIDNDSNEAGGCLRGLERCQFQKRQIRNASKYVVFKEQYRQFTTEETNNNDVDVEKLAQVYKSKTKGSQTLARILAQCDQEYVARIHKQDEEEDVLILNNATTAAAPNGTGPEEKYFPSSHTTTTRRKHNNNSNVDVNDADSMPMSSMLSVSCCTSRAA